MKLIFIALLVGNIAFFVSQAFIGSKTQRPPAGVSERQFGNLQTLAELDLKNGLTPKDKKKPSSVIPQARYSNSGERCQLVGPFAELLHAEFLVERLSGLGAASAIKNVEIADGKNYWVYLKPEMSEKEALRRLYEVQAKSIDSYIIPGGELANGISFGQFSDAADAEKKAEQIRAQGYPAEIREIPKSHNETWVELKEQDAQKISTEHWLELLKEEKSIEKRQNYCLGVAN